MNYYYTHIRCGRGEFQKWSKFCKSWPACLWLYHFFCLLPNSSRFLLCYVPFLFLFVRFTRFSSMVFRHDSTDFGQFTCMSNIDGISDAKCKEYTPFFVSNIDCRYYFHHFCFQSSSFHLILFNLHLSCFISLSKSES